MGLPVASEAASQSVGITDNRFSPQEVHIDPGDTVVWTNQGARVHDVTADDRSFKSEDLGRGESYSHTFPDEGFYYYHCSFHGSRKKVGMWGVVVVGNPDPESDPYAHFGGGVKDERPKLVVPTDFPTIQRAVNAASPGSTIVIRPGVYKSKVVVQDMHNLVIRGVDRFRTVLHGEDKRNTGITVDASRNISIKNLTVRNYVGNGVFINNTTGYTVDRVDAIKGRTYGIYAFDSYDGVIKNSFAWGSGDGGFYIGQCLNCSAIIDNVVAKYNYLGYSGTNATGVVIRDSLWAHNAAGIVPNTLPTEELGPNRGTLVYNNLVQNNNYYTIPGAGFSDRGQPVGIPWGTGIWFPGVENNIALNNTVRNHRSFGILISQSIDESMPVNNMVIGNFVSNSDSDGDGRGWDLAWDGTGESNCFANNHFEGETGPPDIETVYDCANRPYPGVPYAPVQAYLAEHAPTSQTREHKEPPEPNRPHCQRGAPGCNR
ncbi:MAG: right-handed parallel beta-helix repeat-containing protein [Actinomycetota bacterium]|nr:right-handed parallel beta-helix repeat-containing protein [Actinomycetota bacterium]